MSNMAIWDANSSIPQEYTKRAKLNGQEITTYSLQAALLMATRQFGPIGKGWGYEVVEEKNDDGDVIIQAETIIGKDGQKIDQREIRSVLHTLIIRCWYVLDGERYEMPVQAGHTPKVMRTKYGPKFDEEYYKKSLADAIKKSLSMLGFGAEIYLGLLDDQHYLAMKAEEDAIKFESEKAGRIEALKDKVSGYCEAYKYNTLPQSIKAQFTGHMGEVNRECRALNINPDPYIKKMESAANARREELTAKR
jgi:hypothetical protein